MTTPETIVIELTMAGADRGALVADEGEPTVIVFMLSDKAVRELGPKLQHIAGELGDNGGDWTVHLTLKTPMSEIFAACRQAPSKWIWFETQYYQTKVLGAGFAGQSTCQLLAAVCNRAGCPCSLDPDKAAPGYSIDRKIHRG